MRGITLPGGTEVTEFSVPSSWWMMVVLSAHRPSLAPGEWRDSGVYAGRVCEITGERLHFWPLGEPRP